SLRDVLPIDCPDDRVAELLAAFSGLRAGLVQRAGETALRHELLHAGAAHNESPAIDTPGNQQLGKRIPRRLLQIAVPITKPLKGYPHSGIENQPPPPRSHP